MCKSQVSVIVLQFFWIFFIIRYQNHYATITYFFIIYDSMI